MRTDPRRAKSVAASHGEIASRGIRSWIREMSATGGLTENKHGWLCLLVGVIEIQGKQDASGSSRASSAAWAHRQYSLIGQLARSRIAHAPQPREQRSAGIETSALRLASTSPLSLLQVGTTTRSTATSPRGTLPRRPRSCPTSIQSTVFTLGESVANSLMSPRPACRQKANRSPALRLSTKPYCLH